MSLIGAGNVRVRAADWNKAVSDCGRLVPKAGRGIIVDRKRDGSSISADPLFAWRHPWNVVPRWKDGAWKLNIKPGFVNGDPAVVAGTAFTIKSFEKTSVSRPVTVTVGGVTRTVTETVSELTEVFNEKDLELFDVPWWPVVETTQVTDGVPAFFRAKGVENQAPAPEVSTANFDRIDITALAKQAQGERILHSCEVYLSVSRPQLVTSMAVVDATGTSGSLLQYQASYDFTAVNRNGRVARLRQATEFLANPVPDPALRLLGVEPDESEDRLHLSTVYFLSPIGALEGSPDGRWSAFVKHRVFWNLAYSFKSVLPGALPPPAPYFSGLVGGLGDLIINQYQALQDVLLQTAYNNLREDDPAGTFWTT
jgi:hypothetical protein